MHNENLRIYESSTSGLSLLMEQTGALEWTAINSMDKLPLTDTERRRAKAQDRDTEKMEVVKKMLLAGKTPTEIHKATGIARSTIYSYRKSLDKTTRENTQKIREKYTQTTQKRQSVVSCFLIINDLSSQTTLLFFMVLTPLLIAIGGRLWYKYKARKEAVRAHMEESGKLHFLLAKVWDFRFSAEVIICETERQKAWFKKMLVHYKNGGREVLLLPRHLGESATDYDYRKQQERTLYNEANREKIKRGREDFALYKEVLNDNGYLDFLWRYRQGKWLQSKLFIYSEIAYLNNHREPTYGNYARSTKIEFEKL